MSSSNFVDYVKICCRSGKGGAGSLNDIRELVERYSIIGAAAGSLFVFKGKYRAVLINYPDDQERNSMVST